jgi:hypothetical protein
LNSSCRDDSSCGGCAHLGGPGPGGEYWPAEIAGAGPWYWSSSPIMDNELDRWGVNFDDGSIAGGRTDDGGPVRCVRRTASRKNP